MEGDKDAQANEMKMNETRKFYRKENRVVI